MIQMWRPYDDGLGPYIYCKRGLSHCTDQRCWCIDNARYRAMYQMTREQRGWTHGGLPSHLAARLICFGLSGAILGGLIVWLVWYLEISIP